MILHLCSDLMLTAKVSSWAKSNGLQYKNAGSLKKFSAALADKDFHGNGRAVMIDLQFPGLDIPNIVSQVREAAGNIKLAGYVQHVMTDLIAAAESVDFDHVMTRGQFDRQFPSLLAD